jgi:hypothetical protein
MWNETQVMAREIGVGESGKKTRITGVLTFSSAVSTGRELSLKKQALMLVLNISNTSTNKIS